MIRWRRLFRLPFRRDRLREEVDDEIRFHVEMRARRLEQRGWTPEEARREALRRFGSRARVRERLLTMARRREGRMRRARVVDVVRQDLAFAFRQLGKHPGTSVLGVVVLAVAIAATTVVFSIVDGVVLSPLPFRAPDRLVSVREVDPDDDGRALVSPPAYLDWREQATTVEGPVALMGGGGADLTGRGEPVEITVVSVSHDFFRFLGVPPLHGRGLLPSDDPSAPGTLVLSHRLWTRRFGADPGVVGTSVRLRGEPHTVVGVAPPDFDFPAGTEAWVPLDADFLAQRVRGAKVMDAMARLRPGTSREAAQAELASVLERAPDADGWGAALIPLREQLVGDVDRALLLLMAAVGLVLVVACANVGNLLLTRATARRRELAVRTALGASRARVVATVVVEGVLVALLAGLSGVAGAWAGLDLVVGLAPGDLPRAVEIGIDGRVLSFALLATLLTGLAAGLLPALTGRNRDLAATLREGEGRQSVTRSAGRLRAALVVGQIGLTVMLLAGAGLMLRSFVGMVRQDPGFDAAGLVTVDFSLPGYRYEDPERIRGFYRELLLRVEALPGVDEAALSRNLPLGGGSMTSPVVREVPGGVEGSEVAAQLSPVTPGYFRTMGIRVIRGRGFLDEDVALERPVAVLSRSAEREFFPSSNPLGTEARTYFHPEMMEVVGVVEDVRHGSMIQEHPPVFYTLLPAHPARGFRLVLRTRSSPAALVPAVREAVRRIDTALPVVGVRPMSDLVSRSVARPRFYTLLLAAFAGLTLLLAALGLYGVMATGILQRQREIGIRMALGARAARVRIMVLADALRLTAVGVVLGLGAALLGTRVLEGLLFGIQPNDPWTLASVAGVLVLTGVVAVLPTVRRASRVDPVEVLNAQ